MTCTNGSTGKAGMFLTDTFCQKCNLRHYQWKFKVKEVNKITPGKGFASGNIEGLRFCLKIIQELRDKYTALGFNEFDLPIKRFLADIENEIGYKAFKDWKPK